MNAKITLEARISNLTVNHHGKTWNVGNPNSFLRPGLWNYKLHWLLHHRKELKEIKEKERIAS